MTESKIAKELRLLKKSAKVLTLSLSNKVCFYIKEMGAKSSSQYLYQPIFKYKDAKRRQLSTFQRWEAIESAIQNISKSNEKMAALDIGCNMGFFTFNLAQKGFFCLGVDGESELCQFNNEVELLNKGKQASGDGVAVFTQFILDKTSIDSLPSFDVILFLGVWHHITKTHTLVESQEILSKLYNKCNKIMIFESGYGPIERYQVEAKSKMEKDEWMYQCLKECCPGSEINILGEFESRDAGAGKPDGDTRPMYSVKKQMADHK